MLKATLCWLFGPRHVWICALVVVLALAVCSRPGTPDPAIRITGLVLQLMGVLTVVWGIVQTRRFFGRPSILSRFWDWLAAAPFRKPRVVSATGHAILGGVTCKGRGYATHGAGDNPSLESRLDALEKNLAGVHQRITGLEREYDQELRKLGERIRTESGSLKAELGQVQGRFESFGTGGIHISAVGAAWLFVGLILSTASVEIAAWLA